MVKLQNKFSKLSFVTLSTPSIQHYNEQGTSIREYRQRGLYGIFGTIVTLTVILMVILNKFSKVGTVVNQHLLNQVDCRYYPHKDPLKAGNGTLSNNCTLSQQKY